MNILKTTDNGGFPLVLDDFRWIDAGYREAFKALMSPFGITGSQAVILKGCVRTVASGTVSITSGYVSIGGEICVFDAQSYPEPGGGQFEYFELELSFDPAGEKVFQSTLNYDTYQYRKAKITVSSTLPPDHTEISMTPNIFQIIRQKINMDGWQNLLTYIDTEYSTGTHAIDFKKDTGEFVHFQGTKFIEDPSVGEVDILVGTLPEGYRPLVKKTFVLGHTPNATTGALGFITVDIESDGDVRIKSFGGNSAYILVIDFSQIPPFEGS